MKCFNLLCSLVSATALANASPLEARQDTPARNFAGYLISTFSDPNPQVQFHLSKGNTPSEYTFANKGRPVLNSTVGTKGVRDQFLATNDKRDVWYLIATDLDIRVPGFSWGNAVRFGSRSLVVWKSKNLVDWTQSRLVTVENERAGMVWAPSAVWDAKTSKWFVFWSSNQYDASDPNHEKPPAPTRTRYSTTSDFVTFSEPQDYYVPEYGTVIDQEFQYLGKPGHYARFFKNETTLRNWQELSTTGVFGQWTRLPGYVQNDGIREGPACFRDNLQPNKYYLLLDDYTQYLPYGTDDILSGQWRRLTEWTNFPKGLKHGSVTPLTQAEYNRVKKKYID